MLKENIRFQPRCCVSMNVCEVCYYVEAYFAESDEGGLGSPRFIIISTSQGRLRGVHYRDISLYMKIFTSFSATISYKIRYLCM